MNLNRSLPVLTLMLTTAGSPATSLNTLSLIESSWSPSCISWRVNGICYWLKCTMFGCMVLSSTRVSHFLPEAVVSVYGKPGDNPWSEMKLVSGISGGIENAITSGIAGITAGGGNETQKAPGKRSSSLLFKYADAIGHPAALTVSNKIAGFSCENAATPLVPYFLSTLDSLAWRTGIPESFYPEALVPGKRELGSTFSGNMYSPVYPRSGFVNQSDDAKAAAVVAQRVADIITRTGQIHVYLPLHREKSDGDWTPGPVEENTGEKNHKWQPLYPNKSKSCAVFPDPEPATDKAGAAAWTLWQPYSCCKRRGQTFLGASEF